MQLPRLSHDRFKRQLLRATRCILARLPVWLILVGGIAKAEDIVLISSGQEGGAPVRRVGEVLDYNGQTLTLRTSNGATATIPAQRVIEVNAEWNEAHRRGDELFAAGDFAGALEQYRIAVRQEQRAWVRRRLLMQAVWCFRNLDQPEQSANAFLTLASEDPTLLYFDAIPLAWTAEHPNAAFENRLRTWLGGENSIASLIAASWLLSTRERTSAVQTLRELTSHTDPRIALLAEAQLWRTQPSADAAEVARWRRIITRIPEPLRAGPYFVLGQALARVGESQQAALAFLRTPLLYPQQRKLAAESLLAAGRELEQLSRADEAAHVYRELLTNYPDNQLADLAKQRLDRLNP